MSKRNREKRRRPAGPPALDEAMRLVFEAAAAAESGQENTAAHLHLWSHDGTLTIAALALEQGGPQYAAAARALVATSGPAVAVLSCEAWMAAIDARTPKDEQDWAVREWLERRERGENLGVVDLPPDYRTECLLLVGEDAQGHEADALYRIRPAFGEGARRTFEPLAVQGRGSRFRPLFVLERARRQGLPEEVDLLLRGEQAVVPIDRGPQRALARGQVARRARQGCQSIRSGQACARAGSSIRRACRSCGRSGQETSFRPSS
jgi:hypothetical protein